METDPKPNRSGRFENRSGRFSDSGRLLAPEEQPDGTGMRWLVGFVLVAGFGVGMYFLVATRAPAPVDGVQAAVRPSGLTVTSVTSPETEESDDGLTPESAKNLQAWKKLTAAVQATPAPGQKPKRAPVVPEVKDPDFEAIAAGRERADWMYKEQKVFHALPADEQEAVMKKIQSAVHDIEYEPANSAHYLELARIQADSSMHQAVFNTLYQAYKKFPKDRTVLEARASYHQKWGYRQEAEEMYNQMLEIDPSSETAKKGLLEAGKLRYHPIPPVGK